MHQLTVVIYQNTVEHQLRPFLYKVLSPSYNPLVHVPDDTLTHANCLQLKHLIVNHMYRKPHKTLS